MEARDLVLQGQRAFEKVSADQNFYCRERRSGRFVRRLRLPASVEQDRIRAEFRDRVLRVILPKQSYAELSGSIHDKGLLILAGYLRNRYDQDKPLPFPPAPVLNSPPPGSKATARPRPNSTPLPNPHS